LPFTITRLTVSVKCVLGVESLLKNYEKEFFYWHDQKVFKVTYEARKRLISSNFFWKVVSPVSCQILVINNALILISKIK